jgi:hypothetical protein
MLSSKLTNNRQVATRPSSMDSEKAARRTRQPQKAFINVLVRTSTRTALTRLKAEIGLPSQGEVIDYLVAALKRRESSREDVREL